MDIMDIMVEFHEDAERQGPGSDETTLQALQFLPVLDEGCRILDIGCGTGASTMVLAHHTKANITAIDMLPQFLEKLRSKLDQHGLTDRVQVMNCRMEELPFAEDSFDALWAEGSIYNIGFAQGLTAWKKYLKMGGYIAVSEVSWLTDSRPDELEQYWVNAYAEIDTIHNKLSVIKASGYDLLGYFVLPETCWTDHYYTPILARSQAFAERYKGQKEVEDFIQTGLEEAAIYEKYKTYYSYVFYIAQKP